MATVEAHGAPAIGSRWRAHVAMLLFCLLISTSFTVGGLITNAIEPRALMFARFVLATFAMGLVLIATRSPIRITFEAALRYLVLGTLVASYFVVMFVALRHTTPVNIGAIFTMVPLMASGFAYVLMRQKLGLGQLAALVLAALGAVWVLFDGSLANLLAFELGRGEAIFLGGAASYALYTACTRWLHRGEPIVVVAFWSILAGAIVLAFAGFSDIRSTDWSSVRPGVWLGILHLAVANTAVSFYLAKYANTRLPAAKVTAYTYLLPVFVALQQGALGFGWPDIPVVAGIAVIAVAMVLLQRTADR